MEQQVLLSLRLASGDRYPLTCRRPLFQVDCQLLSSCTGQCLDCTGNIKKAHLKTQHTAQRCDTDQQHITQRSSTS